jgi:hypothetical protein
MPFELKNFSGFTLGKSFSHRPPLIFEAICPLVTTLMAITLKLEEEVLGSRPSPMPFLNGLLLQGKALGGRLYGNESP